MSFYWVWRKKLRKRKKGEGKRNGRGNGRGKGREKGEEGREKGKRGLEVDLFKHQNAPYYYINPKLSLLGARDSET